MRIAGLHLKNWIIFAGEHHLKLDAKAYALLARFEGDEGRSNGGGKTSLVESIGYVLYNRHRFRTEDEVISRGEKSCEVKIEFDDGSVATRGRKVGKSTVLTYSVEGRELRGDEAQAEIVRRVGLDEQDFYVTCSLEQRQAARLILATPEERISIVSGWFGLEALEMAEAEARGRAAVLIERRDKIASAIEARRLLERESLGVDVAQVRDDIERRNSDRGLSEAGKTFLSQFQADDEQIGLSLQEKRDAVVEQIATTEASIATARVEVEQRVRDRSAAEDVERLLEDVARYDALVVEGKALKSSADALGAELAALDADAVTARWQDAAGRQVSARRDVEQRRVVAQGRFDGHCPIAELACPARDAINSGRDVARRAHEEASTISRTRDEEARAAAVAATSLRDAQTKHAAAVAKLESARKTAVALKKAADAARGLTMPDFDAIRTAERGARDRLSSLEGEQARLRHCLKLADNARAERVKLTDEQDLLDRQIGTLREATRICGRDGAQRRLAESALRQVQDLANGMLVGAGIDLSVEVRWSREGKGLAVSCTQCGWPFPTSTRVKECTRCRSERGPKLINALELLLSWRSGAGEDLAGLAIQLAASAWLRRSRGSAWQTAILDEPAAQLDATHRRAFVAGIGRMLSSAAFTQSFVVAHHNAIVDSLPGRILVTSDGTRSRVEVVA